MSACESQHPGRETAPLSILSYGQLVNSLAWVPIPAYHLLGIEPLIK